MFEAVDQKRREEEMVFSWKPVPFLCPFLCLFSVFLGSLTVSLNMKALWKRLVLEQGNDSSEDVPLLPSRLVTDDDLKSFYEAMKIYEVSGGEAACSSGMKRKSGYVGGFDTQEYGRGKRAREVS